MSSSGSRVPSRPAPAHARSRSQVERVDPRQLVPDLQVAEVVGREPLRRGLDARADPTCCRAAPAAPRSADRHRSSAAAAREKKFSRMNADVVRGSSASAGFRPSSRYRSCARSAANASSCTSSDGTRLNVSADARELLEQRHHAVVVLERVQPHPRQDVLARHEVLVVRLVHVPEERDAGHGASLVSQDMFRILDRYLVREIVLPFFLGAAVLTFILEIPPILHQAEQLIAKGVDWSIVMRVLATAAAAGARPHDSDGASCSASSSASAGCRPIANSSRCRPAASA